MEYLRSQNLTVQDMFNTICQKIASGEYSTSKTSNGKQARSTDYCCFACATQIFSQLVYNYRAAIPKSSLPREVAERQDCWYGRECRTQTHNLNHAKRLNHICENIKK